MSDQIRHRSIRVRHVVISDLTPACQVFMTHIQPGIDYCNFYCVFPCRGVPHLVCPDGLKLPGCSIQHIRIIRQGVQRNLFVSSNRRDVRSLLQFPDHSVYVRSFRRRQHFDRIAQHLPFPDLRMIRLQGSELSALGLLI